MHPAGIQHSAWQICGLTEVDVQYTGITMKRAGRLPPPRTETRSRGVRDSSP